MKCFWGFFHKWEYVKSVALPKGMNSDVHSNS